MGARFGSYWIKEVRVDVMKWIFISLLIINIGGGGYIYLKKDKVETTAPVPVKVELNNLALKNPQPLPAKKVAPKIITSCTELGPINEQETATNIKKRLAALDLSSTIVEKQIVVKTDYWVILGPYNSKTRADLELKALKKKGIKDSYVMNNSEFKQVISLGLFGSKENAQRHADQLAKQSVDAKLSPIERTKAEFWIDIAPKSGYLFSDEMLLNLQKNFDGLESRKKTC